MELNFAAQHLPGRKHITADNLSRLLMSDTDDSNIDDYTPVYVIADAHAVARCILEEKVRALTIHSFSSAQRKEANCHLFTVSVDASHSQYFYDKDGILSRRA